MSDGRVASDRAVVQSVVISPAAGVSRVAGQRAVDQNTLIHTAAIRRLVSISARIGLQGSDSRVASDRAVVQRGVGCTAASPANPAAADPRSDSILAQGAIIQRPAIRASAHI